MVRASFSEETQFIASLFEVPQEIEEGSLQAFLSRIVERCEAWFDASAVSLFLASEPHGPLEHAASCGEISSVPKDSLIEVGVGIAGIAVAEGTPALINDAEFQPKFRSLVGRRSAMISSMVVPLVTPAGPMGVLNVARALGKHQFSADDLRLAQSVAGHLALAVENARLVANLRSAVLELEQQRAESDRLKRLAEIGQLTAAIAHEIRNPLTGIRGAAQMIKEDQDSASEYAAIIEEETAKLNDLCTEFLNFAKPIELRREEFAFPTLVERVTNLMRAEFEQKQIQLDVEILDEMPKMIGDEPRWEQVLRNLLINALHASHAGSRVVVKLLADGFRVEDKGTGMDADQVDRLFSPFFTTKPFGTGLGLSTVKKIVDAHKAVISVTTQSGEGTTFAVDFQARKAA